MIAPKDIEKAVLLARDGHIKEAEALYNKMLKAEPDNYMLLSAVGLLYISERDFEKACKCLEKACEIQKTFGTVSALGLAYYEAGDFQRAADVLESSLDYGDSADIYNKLILSLFKAKNYKKATDYSAVMHQKYPSNPNSVSNMIKSLTQLGKLAEAEVLCVNYLKEHQDSGGLWIHLGFLKELIYSDDKQAERCFRIAYDLGHTDALYNIAVSLQKQGRFGEAEETYRKMLELYPQNRETITSLGMCLMKQKKFKEGYELFFQRAETEIDKKSHNPWTFGEDFGKEVVVLTDQGYGDHIQFARYLPYLKEKTEKLVITVREPMRELFEKNFPEYKYITYNEIDSQMQSVRITDLAYALGMNFEHIPLAGGYLKAEKAEICSEKPKIGLCWEAGSAGIRTMINRTINIRLLEPILNLNNVQIYSFQVQDTLKGNERYPQMVNLAKDFKNFYDTAKALMAMDVVISVDTAVAHLAGALGVKTFLMLPYSSDWRWFDDTEKTPWYDSVRIFKQQDPLSWEKPIEDIICTLNEYYL